MRQQKIAWAQEKRTDKKNEISIVDSKISAFYFLIDSVKTSQRNEKKEII